MFEMKTTYQSKNWDKRLQQYCEENRRKKAIRKSLTKKQKKQVQEDLKFDSNFIKQTFKNMENKQIN